MALGIGNGALSVETIMGSCAEAGLVCRSEEVPTLVASSASYGERRLGAEVPLRAAASMGCLSNPYPGEALPQTPQPSQLAVRESPKIAGFSSPIRSRSLDMEFRADCFGRIRLGGSR